MGLVMRYKIFQFPETKGKEIRRGMEMTPLRPSQASIQEFSDYHGDGKFQ